MIITVAAYTITANRSRESKNEILSNLNGIDFEAIVVKFLTGRKVSAAVLQGQKEMFRTKTIDNSKRCVSGWVEKGDYGYSANGVNISTEKVSYTRSTDDAEMLPFYYMIYTPKNSNTAILLLQRFGHLGIYTSFVSELKAYLRYNLSGYVFKLEPLILREMVNNLAKSDEAKKIKFRSYQIPKDVADLYGYSLHAKEAYVEYSIIAKKDKTLSKLAASITKTMFQKTRDGEVMSIAGFTPDEMLMEVSLNGRKRTINLQDPSSLRSYYDITDEVKINPKTGHPTQDSIIQSFSDLRDDLWQAMTTGKLVKNEKKQKK